jgi:hypothetical protein
VFDHRDDADDLGEQGRRPGPGSEVCGHRVDERIGVVQHERQKPIDAVAPFGDAGRPGGDERPPLAVQDRAQFGATGLDRVEVSLRGTHRPCPSGIGGPASAASHPPIVVSFGRLAGRIL